MSVGCVTKGTRIEIGTGDMTRAEANTRCFSLFSASASLEPLASVGRGRFLKKRKMKKKMKNEKKLKNTFLCRAVLALMASEISNFRFRRK
jgi:hypothetical protein